MPRRARSPQPSLTVRDLGPVLRDLRKSSQDIARAWPGEATERQPIHTVYGGAHLFRADTAQKLGAVALATLDEYAPDGAAFAAALGLTADGAASLRARVVEKLRAEPVEDYRLDFEDGYGHRPDEEEDAHAQSAAGEVAAGMRAGTLPPFIGIRIKPLSAELHRRSLRTLDLFIAALIVATEGRLPAGFAITLPKLMSPRQVSAVAAVCAALERRLRLARRSLRLELMIETPQSMVGADGALALRAMVDAGGGRVVSAHFGAYDYTALCGITSARQDLRHPACDFARHMMQVALAQTGIRLSDGATTILPLAPHRAQAGTTLTASQRRENREAVHCAWKQHFDDVSSALSNGFYQGWDLHPAQLPTRYAAVYEFFRSARPAATARLRHFVDAAARATRMGSVFDDAATGQGLVNFFVRGVSSGALTGEQVAETGLTMEELQGRSFLRIVRDRSRQTE